MSIETVSPVVSPVAKDWVVYSDRRFAPLSDVAFKANTQALNYGTGVFEGIRAYWDDERRQLNLFRGRDHFARFINSARTLRIEVDQAPEEFVAITRELIRRNGFRQDIYVRPLLLKKSLMPGERFGVKLRGVDSTLCINAMPMGAYAAAKQFRCIVSKWQRVADAAIPSAAKITGTYVNSALAYEDARDHGADDAIMLNARGECTEATTSNVFIVKDRMVLTPALGAGILAGVTRDCVLQICDFLDIPVAEATITIEDLRSADQCFLTGTGVEIKMVSDIDGRALATDEGSVAHEVSDLYQRIVRGQVEQFSSWLHPIY
jgi:branched-chain amino acid aminotransferase